MPTYVPRSLLRKRAGAVGNKKDQSITVTACFIIGNIVACNVGKTPEKFCIALVQGGSKESVDDYLYLDKALPAGDTFIHGHEINLSPGDTLRLQSSGGGVAFHVFGEEKR